MTLFIPYDGAIEDFCVPLRENTSFHKKSDAPRRENSACCIDNGSIKSVCWAIQE